MFVLELWSFNLFLRVLCRIISYRCWISKREWSGLKTDWKWSKVKRLKNSVQRLGRGRARLELKARAGARVEKRNPSVQKCARGRAEIVLGRRAGAQGELEARGRAVPRVNWARPRGRIPARLLWVLFWFDSNFNDNCSYDFFTTCRHIKGETQER